MNLCPQCAADVIPGAKFCHRCGDKIIEKLKECPSCQEANPLSSVFCHHCGYHFDGTPTHKYAAKYSINFEAGDITDQIKALFFRSLRFRVGDEHDISRYSEYVSRFYESSFKQVYEVRARQIGADAETHWCRFGVDGLPEIDKKIDHAFDGLLDYFIISFCPDLNNFVFPETILKYEQAKPGKTDLYQMSLDYLNLPRETETIYQDFITMSADYLANACKSYLFAQRKERVFFIVDLSLKGNCKEGFALTDKGIYWKMPFDKASMFYYGDIESVTREKDWLLINKKFFTVNPTLNLKLYKLIKKVKGWKV